MHCRFEKSKQAGSPRLGGCSPCSWLGEYVKPSKSIVPVTDLHPIGTTEPDQVDVPWYRRTFESQRTSVCQQVLSRDTRNDHVHGGPSPVVGGSFYQGKVTYRFREQNEFGPDDIVFSCRSYFITLLTIVYDCYAALGVHVDPQQYYTRENFASMCQTIDHAELEVWGWVMTSYIKEGLDEDDRWHEIRGRVGQCQINHLFNGYLRKVTPQPPIPDRIRDIDFTDEDRGWIYIPPGFDTIEDYDISLQNACAKKQELES